MAFSPRQKIAPPLLVLGGLAVSCHGPDDIVATWSAESTGGGAASTGGTNSTGGTDSIGGGGAESPDSYELRPLTGDLEVHDPALAFSEGKFFLFHTGPLLTLKTSSDLVEWQTVGSAFEQFPDWIPELLPNATNLWAPDLIEFGGLFHLYYAASTFGTGVSCIGHASTATLSVGATWNDQGPVICSDVDEQVDWDAIDPSIFRDENGAHHMVFGSYSSGIKMIHLNADGNRSGDGLLSLAVRPDTAAIQAPTAVYRAPYYYLFPTFDRCCAGVNSTSSVRIGRATSVEGPYVDRAGIPLLEGGGSVLLEGTDMFPGVGAGSLLSVNQQTWIAYHAYDANAAGRATLRISELEWDAEGWPVTSVP